MYSGKRATFGPLVVVFLSIGKGEDLISVGVSLHIVGLVDDVGYLFFCHNKIIEEVEIIMFLQLLEVRWAEVIESVKGVDRAD